MSNKRRVFDIGYIGYGDYKINHLHNGINVYNRWKYILKRCYSEKHHLSNPVYKDVVVCEEWHNFQNFAKWFEENYYEVDGEMMEIDKDILVRGNKVYSPNTCVFVPRTINSLLTYEKSNDKGLPIGVHKREYGERYTARVTNPITRKNESCGTFQTPQEAFEAYKSKKEMIIKSVANKYKKHIPKEVYNSLMEWTI